MLNLQNRPGDVTVDMDNIKVILNDLIEINIIKNTSKDKQESFIVNDKEVSTPLNGEDSLVESLQEKETNKLTKR